jgi:hypothetical protein
MTNKKLNILLISYYFPPYNSIGAIRPSKMSKFFYESNHHIHVITASNQPFPDNLDVEIPQKNITYCNNWSINSPIEYLLGGRTYVSKKGYQSSYSFLHKLGIFYKLLFHWPDAQFGWVNSAIIEGTKLCESKKFDLIYVSAPAFSGLRVAKKLSSLYKTPWIAEFRDLWTENHAYNYPKWRKWLEQYWESSLLSTASAFVTVSEPLVNQLSVYGKPTWEIRNGYDPNDRTTHVNFDKQNVDQLEIVFTGNIYEAYYNLDAFCEGIALFKLSGGKIRVHIAGRNTTSLLTTAKKYNIEHVFDHKSTIERSLALGMQQSADILLLFLWNNGESHGIYTTKFFEYASTRNPILAIGKENSDIALLIKEAKIGNTASSPIEIAVLLKAWQQQKQKEGHLRIRSNTHYDFSRSTQFIKLEHLLSKLICK